MRIVCVALSDGVRENGVLRVVDAGVPRPRRGEVVGSLVPGAVTSTSLLRQTPAPTRRVAHM